MVDIRVREAVLEDVDAIQAVGLMTWPPTYVGFTSSDFVLENLTKWWTAEAVSEGITRDNTWVAESPEGSIVGTCTLGKFRDEAVLWKLYVLPSQQGSGIGTTLLDTALSALPADQDLILEFVGGNSPAEEFYTRRGFCVERTDSNENGTTTVWCRLRR